MLKHLLHISGCSTLDTPDKGTLIMTSSQYSSVASFSCNNGYVLQGSQQLTCMDSGNWSGVIPVCRIIGYNFYFLFFFFVFHFSFKYLKPKRLDKKVKHAYQQMPYKLSTSPVSVVLIYV